MTGPENERLAQVEQQLSDITERLNRQFGELREALAALGTQLSEVCTNLRGEFVPVGIFNERGARFDKDFAQVTTDTAVAKKAADEALVVAKDAADKVRDTLNERIDEQQRLMNRIFITTIVLGATLAGNVVLTLLKR